MKPGDLVIPKYLPQEVDIFKIEPELILELDHEDDIATSIRYGKRYAFWKVLKPDGTIGKLCDVADEESVYEIIACGSGV